MVYQGSVYLMLKEISRFLDAVLILQLMESHVILIFSFSTDTLFLDIEISCSHLEDISLLRIRAFNTSL